MATYLIGNVKGPKGEDGYSPKASVTQTSNGAIISIQDADGLTTAEIRNGVDGDGNNIDLSPYATKVEVEGDFEALADTYATIDYVDQEVAGVVAPVTSVNGQVGDVNITLPDLTGYATQTWVTGQGYLTEAPVATVNGQTGTVELDAEDVGALPEDTVIPTKVSDLTNDSGFLNATTLAPYLANKQDTLTAGSNITISNNVISASGGSNFSGDYDDLTNKPDLSVYAESADLATVATTGDYDDLTNTPTIPTVPTNVSDFTNDAGYITSADLPADELPAITTGDAGKVLAVNSNEDGVEWTTASSGGATYTAGDAIEIDNNILNVLVDGTTIDLNGNNELTVIGGGGGGATYTAGDGIEIDANNEISNIKQNLFPFSFDENLSNNAPVTKSEFIERLKKGEMVYTGNKLSGVSVSASDFTTGRTGIIYINPNNSNGTVAVSKSAGSISLNNTTWYYYIPGETTDTLYRILEPSMGIWESIPIALNNEWSGNIPTLKKLFNDKQNVLTAGTGITISSNTISADSQLPTIASGDAGKVLTVNSGATGVEWAEASGGDSYTAGYGISIDENNTIINDKAYDFYYLPVDMVDTVGFGINYNGVADFDEFTETDSVVGSELVDDSYSELRLMIYLDEDRNEFENNSTLEFVEESTDKKGNTYYEWSDGAWTFRCTITGQDEVTYTLTVDYTLNTGVYVNVETKEIVPITAEYLTAIPVDGTTIQYNSNGQLEAVSSGGGSGTTYTAGNGIDITNDEISVDTSVVATKTDLSAKQNTLTAGTGISISNNVISATGGGSGGGSADLSAFGLSEGSTVIEAAQTLSATNAISGQGQFDVPEELTFTTVPQDGGEFIRRVPYITATMSFAGTDDTEISGIDYREYDFSVSDIVFRPCHVSQYYVVYKNSDEEIYLGVNYNFDAYAWQIDQIAVDGINGNDFDIDPWNEAAWELFGDLTYSFVIPALKDYTTIYEKYLPDTVSYKADVADQINTELNQYNLPTIDSRLYGIEHATSVTSQDGNSNRYFSGINIGDGEVTYRLEVIDGVFTSTKIYDAINPWFELEEIRWEIANCTYNNVDEDKYYYAVPLMGGVYQSDTSQVSISILNSNNEDDGNWQYSLDFRGNHIYPVVYFFVNAESTQDTYTISIDWNDANQQAQTKTITATFTTGTPSGSN